MAGYYAAIANLPEPTAIADELHLQVLKNLTKAKGIVSVGLRVVGF